MNIKPAPALAIKPVTYVSSNKREYGWLRLALVEAWDFRCYLCNASGDSTDFDVDHIVPQDKRKEGMAAYDLIEPFDIHGLENLAPACAAGRSCNVRKSNTVLFGNGKGAVVFDLEEARRKAPKVEAQVRSLRSSRGLAKKLVTVISAPLDAVTTKAFAVSGRSLAQRLYEIEPTLVESYTSRVQIAPNSNLKMGDLGGCAPDEQGDIVISLDKPGRQAFFMLSESTGEKPEELIMLGLTNIVDEVESSIKKNFDKSNVQFDIQGYRGISIDSLLYQRESSELIFKVCGNYSSSHTASGLIFDEDGQVSNESTQEDLYVEGKFCVAIRVSGDFGEMSLKFETYTDEIEYFRL